MDRSVNIAKEAVQNRAYLKMKKITVNRKIFSILVKGKLSDPKSRLIH